MLLLAATALEKVKDVPPMFWFKVAAVLIGFIVAVILIQKVWHMNKLVLALIIFVVGGIMGFTWIYERNEPAFLTPIIEPIADSGFFPTKGGNELRSLNEDGTKGPKKTTTPAPAKK
jgi:TctA family transporter